MGAGKWIGGILGFMTMGPLGALAGFALGSLLDGNNGLFGNTYEKGQAEAGNYDEGQRNSFLFSMLVMASYIIRADGRIMHSEMEYVRQFLRMNFGEEAVIQGEQILLNLFEQRKQMERQNPMAFKNTIHECGAQIAANLPYEQRLQLLDFLVNIAKSDGSVCSEEIAALKEVADEITAAGGEVYAVSTDISKPEDPEMLMQKVMDKYGKIDILVNNAGILEQGLKPIDKFLDEDMDRIIETNEKGTMRCMRAASKRMTTGGAIVNVASVAGEKGCGGAAYVASKAAVIGLTKHTALRFQKDGIRCNAICPGNIITPMTMGTDPKALDPDMIGAMMTHSDIKAQSCTAEDVANVVLFFASDEARAITGQIIVTDFGAML